MKRSIVKLNLPPIAGAAGAKVEIDGQDITEGVKGLQLYASNDRETVLIVHYACYNIEVEGEMRVRHMCGLGKVQDGGEEE